MQTYMILRRSAWKDEIELHDSTAMAQQVADDEMDGRVKWIRSYMLDEEDGTLGTACIYQAEDEDALLEHAQRADMSADEVIAIVDTIITRDDP